MTMKKAILILVAAVFGLTSSFAQPGQGFRGQGQGNRAQGFLMNGQGDCSLIIPNLSEDQKSEIQDLRVDFLKEMQQNRNELDVLRAENKKLATSVNPDQKAINKNIDQQTAMMNSSMKAQSAHRQEVRKLLNDDQKLYFDSRTSRMGQGRGNNMGYGNRPMKGNAGRNYGRRANCPFR
jgi:hypothetical protein